VQEEVGKCLADVIEAELACQHRAVTVGDDVCGFCLTRTRPWAITPETWNGLMDKVELIVVFTSLCICSGAAWERIEGKKQRSAPSYVDLYKAGRYGGPRNRELSRPFNE
jgi:hypothetical protein